MRFLISKRFSEVIVTKIVRNSVIYSVEAISTSNLIFFAKFMKNVATRSLNLT